MSAVLTPRRDPDTDQPRRSTPRIAARVGTAGVLGAAAGATVLYGYGSLVAAGGVPMSAGDPWSAAAEPVAPANFAFGVVVCTFWGTLLALGLALRASRPASMFLRTATVLVGVSLVMPLCAVDTAATTRIALAVGHLLAAAVVVPALCRALRGTSAAA